MDVVITYVNGADKEWQRLYSEATQKPVLAKRYRDWGFMPFLLRGIEKYMPFVERVFLVVSSQSQVPEWVNRENVRVVLHEQIIPTQYLPTFNSTTIELFLHRIPDLSEQFIYFNDDLFPINPIEATDLFRDDKVVMHFAKHLLALGLYKKQTKTSDRQARKALALSSWCPIFVRPQHTITPMLKSEQRKLFALIESELEPHITPLRRKDNANQYIFSDYLYYSRKVIEKRIPTKHCSMAVCDEKTIAAALFGDTNIVCINDVEMTEPKLLSFEKVIREAFEQKFPTKSKFER